MRCFTPRIIEASNNNITIVNKDQNDKTSTNLTISSHSKPVIQSYRLKKKISPGYSLNDLDKFNVGNAIGCVGEKKSAPISLSVESLKNILCRSTEIGCLDVNGEILCRHESAPDFKKIFVTEFIWVDLCEVKILYNEKKKLFIYLKACCYVYKYIYFIK